MDYGDLLVVFGYILEIYKKIEEGLVLVVNEGIIFILLGGDYLMIFGEFCVIVKKYGLVVFL